VGIQTARKALKENENPLPVFQIDPTSIGCTILAVFSENSDEKVLQTIEANPHVTLDELGAIAHKSRATIARSIARLKGMDLIAREGSDKTGHWVIQKDGTKTNE